MKSNNEQFFYFILYLEYGEFVELRDMVVPSRGDCFLFFCLCLYFVFVNICTAYCPITGNVESRVPLMLDVDDDDYDRTTPSTTEYYTRQCMHCFLLAA